jgi:hypothetical protein
MGRYFRGDIEGKFWFALQPSDAPSKFGGEILEPSFIEYYFDENSLEGVIDEIERIEETLGENKKIIEDFFSSRESYSSNELIQIGITQDILGEYANLKLGIQIRDCILENGTCSFEAEI